MLDEKLKKIDEVFKMVFEMYRNGFIKGFFGIFEGINFIIEMEE